MSNEINLHTYGPPKSGIREFAEQLLVTIIMALFLMTFIAQAVAVPTGSMQNTINIGDHLFVNKFIFGKQTSLLGGLLPTREIKRGDIIVFKLPDDPKVNYVKRVIGLPGDEVLVKGHRVFVNGKELPEERLAVKLDGHQSDPDLPVAKTEPKPEGAWYKIYYDADRATGDDDFDFSQGQMKFGVREPVKIPENSYFVMGDSRDNSLDSRYWGFVPRENVFARALYVHLSFDPRSGDGTTKASPLGKLFNVRLKRTGTPVK
ncbi:MAG: signal peptidase I [Blastocatellia bacterium]|nr:signal peptidase I [Blastocatellia bacterium]